MVVVERYCRKCGAVCVPGTPACAMCGASLKMTTPLTEDIEFSAPSLHLTQHLHAQQLLHERYRIVRQVGVGGFGAVYEAEDMLEQQRVAIKEIGLAGLDAQQVIEATGSFNREVQMLSSLRHASIPRMYEQLTDVDHWYLVMEFIVGETLEELLERADGGCLPLQQALRIGEQICDVLSYLHNQQPAVIFRDVKPANIMLTPEGKLYLIDFGVARFFKPDKARDTIAFGSPGYAAPEQYGRAQTTPRADIYSLGVLLHQMLTGSDPSLDPFHFQPLRASDSSLPVALEKLLVHMLAEDREQRPASCEEVEKRLKSIATSPGVLRHARMTAPQGSQQPATETTAPAFSTIGVTVFIYRGHNLPVKALNWSPDGSALVSCDEGWHLHIWDAFRHSSRKVTSPRIAHPLDLAWSPDGSILALADADHVVRLWHLKQHPRWWRMLALSLGYLSSNYERHTSPVATLCWSPDGQMIASAETKNTIHVWKIRTRESLLVYQGHAEGAERLAWSPDGTRIASCSNNQIHIWRASDGAGRWRWRPQRGLVHTLAWSPDSRYLACGGSDKAIYVWDTSNNHKVYVYHGHKASVKSLAWSPDGQRIASASFDRTVHIWSALDGRDAFLYHGHQGSVTVVAWSPDGQSLASAGEDATVHIWKTL
ncbi:MAG TPA: protein kinase [Ktedonobacteraceae bacterium]